MQTASTPPAPADQRDAQVKQAIRSGRDARHPHRRARARPPILRLQEATEDVSERHATWTELFFDLVFVVAVAQLAAGLHDHVSLNGVAAFAGLFVPVVWTWTTYAYLGDLFDADEGLFRFVLLAAMLLVAGFAATIPAAFRGHSRGFVVAYALLRVDIVALYAWAWRTDPNLRVLARKHTLGLGLGLAVWLASLAFAEPARYAVWALAIAVDLMTGVAVYRGGAQVPRQRSHMPERFGLLTLIVLGESIIAVSVGTIRAHWAASSLLTAAAAFALAAGLWWTYFARFDQDVFNWALGGGPDTRRRSFVYGYAHLALYPALTAVGVGVKLAIESAINPTVGHRAPVVLGLGLATYLTSLSAIQAAAPRGLGRGAAITRGILVAGALLMAAFGSEFPPAVQTTLMAGAVSGLAMSGR
jgi:low temperature requirement protein LtrA